jgi:hypothetical protein
LLSDDEWTTPLFHLLDNFLHLNELNKKIIQCKKEVIVDTMDKMQGFRGTLKLWLQHVASGSTETFPICAHLLHRISKEYLNAPQQKFSVLSVGDFDRFLYTFRDLPIYFPLNVQKVTYLNAGRTHK